MSDSFALRADPAGENLVELDRRIEELATAHGADFYGIADLSPAREAILAQGGSWVAGFGRAVSLGIALLNEIVDQLPHRDQKVVATSYRHHCYDLVNVRLDLAASAIGSTLQGLGYRTLPVPASLTTDREAYLAMFSHKMAAHLAGLGWIGKSCLLVTPQAGPRVRWATILTDAPLSPSLPSNGLERQEDGTSGPIAERCGACTLCVDVCPVGAFSGRPFRHGEPRDLRFDAGKCSDYFDQQKENGLDPVVCGMCLFVCPHGRKGTNSGPNQDPRTSLRSEPRQERTVAP
jgi:epoxyqueuosine reductase QueG